MSEPLDWRWLGRVGYAATLELQEATRERVLAGEPGGERLLLLEHEPVLTLGRSASAADILAAPEELAARGVARVGTSRGGGVTAHGPGQLVIYPVVRVAGGVRRFVAVLGETLAAWARARGAAAAEWRPEPAGVWVGERKLAACGLHVSHGVAIHGFAINVTVEPLGLFRLIVPCGLRGVAVTSLESEGGRGGSLSDLAAELGPRIVAALGRDPQSDRTRAHTADPG